MVCCCLSDKVQGVSIAYQTAETDRRAGDPGVRAAHKMEDCQIDMSVNKVWRNGRLLDFYCLEKVRILLRAPDRFK